MIKTLEKTKKNKIDGLYGDFLRILSNIGRGETCKGFINGINETILNGIERDSDEAVHFISLILDVQLNKYKNISDKQFADIIRCIVEALFLNISQLLDIYSGSDKSVLLQNYLSKE